MPELSPHGMTLKAMNDAVAPSDLRLLLAAAERAQILQDALRTREQGGNTPLHLAAATGHIIGIDLLLGRGADPSLVNTFGAL